MDREFHYSVPERWRDDVREGTRVRVELHGRRVGGWVTAVAVDPPKEIELKPLAGLSGWGPPAEVVALAGWAAWRWAGRRAHFLATASPPRVVRHLPAPAGPSSVAVLADPATRDALSEPRSVVRLAPAGDIVPWAMAIGAKGIERGGSIIVVPTGARAAWLARQLIQRGLPAALLPDDWDAVAAGGVIAVGTRSAAWAPLRQVGAAMVVDSHDEALREERAPTWDAAEVLAERCDRDGSPCVRLSPCPTLEDLEWGRLIVLPRADERGGWPPLEVLDRREADPRDGLLTPRVVAAVRAGGRVVCVINRRGRAGLLACAACQTVATCEKCGDAVGQNQAGMLECGRCGERRPQICLDCGSGKLKALRPGTTRLAEHLSALAGHPIPELSGAAHADEAGTDERVVIGTEAALRRAGRRDTVIFLDFDQELLAPRLRAGEQALALLARAARMVRGRQGRVIVQTRQPDHVVLRAARSADPGLVADAERAQRDSLGLPPFSAMALVTGPGAEELVAGVHGDVAVAGHAERHLVRAPDTTSLCDALARAPRPSARVRVEVDPRRI
ncbi:MAG: hypothetical protein KY395_04885 [Actinobacteria bacterium]|nr:hypothetical protein [Actinomycetota bacterium]